MEEEQEESKQPMSLKKKVWIIVLTVLATLLLIYLFLSIYFIRHFYWGTAIDDVQVGGRSVTKVEKILEREKEAYILTLKERDNESEEIKGTDIGLKLEARDQIEEVKHKQNGFAWLFQLGSDKKYSLEKAYTYDEAKLKTVMKALKCLDSKHNKQPENARVIYEEGSFVIKEGASGNLVDQDRLWQKLTEAIASGKKEIDLEADKCYKGAQYQADSKEIVDFKTLFNNYLKSEITYQIGNNTEKLTAEQVKEWLVVDENMKGSLDRSQVEGYVEALADKYNTTGKARTFKTSSGNEIQISGGDYGWAIDETRETHELVKALQSYTPTTRTPIYSQEAKTYNLADDIGNTYVEINLTSQYLWLYRDGKRITEGSIVSGTADGKHATPPGVYKIDYMQKNAILRGPGYACPVAYWMPFNEDIGLHDATWRGSFGGNIYQYNGSHGCINCPYDLVQTIFNNVETGTAVVCYQ